MPDLDDADGDGFFYSDCSDVTITIDYAVVPTDISGCDPTDPCCQNLQPTTALTYIPVTPVNGVYRVTDLPIGLAWFRYNIVDACGNVLSTIPSTKDVVIRDNTPPTAICEGFTKIPLDADGEVVVNAFTFDDGSRDECLSLIHI